MSQLVCVSPFYAPTPSNTIFLPDCHKLFLVAIIYSCICKPEEKARHICMFLKTVPVSRCQWLINLSVDSFLFINKCKQCNYIQGRFYWRKKSNCIKLLHLLRRQSCLIEFQEQGASFTRCWFWGFPRTAPSRLPDPSSYCHTCIRGNKPCR